MLGFHEQRIFRDHVFQRTESLLARPHRFICQHDNRVMEMLIELTGEVLFECRCRKCEPNSPPNPAKVDLPVPSLPLKAIVTPIGLSGRCTVSAIQVKMYSAMSGRDWRRGQMLAEEGHSPRTGSTAKPRHEVVIGIAATMRRSSMP